MLVKSLKVVSYTQISSEVTEHDELLLESACKRSYMRDVGRSPLTRKQ